MFTTVIGSYPLNYKRMGKDAIRYSVQDQMKAGIDLVSDGQTRSDMIEYFATVIQGYHFDGKSQIMGQIGHSRPDLLLSDLEVAQELTPHVKGIITGPVTLVFSSKIKAVYQGFHDEKVYLDTAKALLEIAQALEHQGAEWIQIDEPYLSVGAPMDIARKAIESIAQNIKVPVALHVCGKVQAIFESLLEWQGITLLSHGFKGEDNLPLLKNEKLIKSQKSLGLGCINTKQGRVEDVPEIREIIEKALQNLPPDRLVIHPDCGLRSLGDREIAFNKMKNMVLAARQAQR